MFDDSRSDGTVSFKYDPFGRRIYKSSSSGTFVFAYDGDNLVEETNSGGTAVARYSQGLNIDEPLAMLNRRVAHTFDPFFLSWREVRTGGWHTLNEAD